MQTSSSDINDKKRVLLIVALIGLFFALAWPWLPSQDPATYFDFADQRQLWDVPNFFDVTSNLFFALVGGFGIVMTVRAWATAEKSYTWCYLLLSLGVFFTSLGSAYFHWGPEPRTLFWDRFPMAIGFASLLTLFLVDHLKIQNYVLCLSLVNSISVLAVINVYWGLGDLRPYLIVQFGFLLLILAMAIVINKGRIPRKYLLLGLKFYILAKLLEVMDHQIFEAVGISGHTLKHIAAATAVLYLNQGMYKFFFTAR